MEHAETFLGVVAVVIILATIGLAAKRGRDSKKANKGGNYGDFKPKPTEKQK